MRLETPNGPIFMPQIALGTWEYGDKDVHAAITNGIKAGFTHVDTANNYRNQRAVGDVRCALSARSACPRPREHASSLAARTRALAAAARARAHSRAGDPLSHPSRERLHHDEGAGLQFIHGHRLLHEHGGRH
jgi:hypothetical protein